MEADMGASATVTGSGPFAERLLMERRKGKEGGWEAGRAFAPASETENRPQIQGA